MDMSILTTQQAYQALNFNSADDMPPRVTSIILPAVDEFIANATGKDWGTLTDTYKAINPLAILAASVLLVRWFLEFDPLGTVTDVGVLSMIGQLRAKYLVESAG
jgi:hypothetical protein